MEIITFVRMINLRTRLLLFGCFLFIGSYGQTSPLPHEPIPAEKGAEIFLNKADTAYYSAKYNLALLKTAETEKENETLKLREEYLRKQINQRYWLQILSNIILLAALLFIVILIYQKRKLKKVNLELQLLNREIGEQKDRLENTATHLGTSNVTLQKFISIIAHDLKNPINTIMGFTEILIGDKDDLNKEEQRKALEFTNRAAQGAFKLLEQLLEWARMHTGIIKADPQKISLHDLYSEAIAVVYPSAILKHQEIKCEIAENITAMADWNMMLTLFRNLLSNAVKFTPNGGKISITAVAEKDYVTIAFTDTGIGIPADQIDHLFRIDQQYKTKGTAGETGTGLGLLLCREYVEKNKGSIKVQSESWKGTTVTIILPAR